MSAHAILLHLPPTLDLRADCQRAWALARLARAESATVVSVAALPVPRVLCQLSQPLAAGSPLVPLSRPTRWREVAP